MNVLSIIQAIKNYIKKTNNNGFTLIEAIVTIGIVGIVIGPIALIFQGALVSSLESRDQLKANQLAQQYVETLKILPYDDMSALNDDVFDPARVTDLGKVLPGDISHYLLPNTTTDFDVFIRLLDETTDVGYNTEFSDRKFEMPSLSLPTIDLYDVCLKFNLASDSGFEIYNQANTLAIGTPLETLYNVSTNREIHIVIKKSLDSTKLQYDIQQFIDGTKGISTIIEVDAATARKEVVIYNEEITAANITSDILVENTSGEKVKFYIFNQPDYSMIQLKTGEMETIDTSEIKSYSHRLYEVEVVVEKNGEVLESVTTTVLAK